MVGQRKNMQSPGETNDQNSSFDSSEKTSRNTEEFAKAKEAKVVDQLAEAANQVLDVIAWLGKKLNSSGNVFRIEDAKGSPAEVSIPIPRGGIGEVTVIIGQTRKNYSAKAVSPEAEYGRGSKVRIADVAISTVYVDTLK
jgi:hypothetical protein